MLHTAVIQVTRQQTTLASAISPETGLTLVNLFLHGAMQIGLLSFSQTATVSQENLRQEAEYSNAEQDVEQYIGLITLVILPLSTHNGCFASQHKFVVLHAHTQGHFALPSVIYTISKQQVSTCISDVNTQASLKCCEHEL
jgi:hypothetical protein